MSAETSRNVSAGLGDGLPVVLVSQGALAYPGAQSMNSPSSAGGRFTSCGTASSRTSYPRAAPTRRTLLARSRVLRQEPGALRTSGAGGGRAARRRERPRRSPPALTCSAWLTQKIDYLAAGARFVNGSLRRRYRFCGRRDRAATGCIIADSRHAHTGGSAGCWSGWAIRAAGQPAERRRCGIVLHRGARRLRRSLASPGRARRGPCHGAPTRPSMWRSPSH